MISIGRRRARPGAHDGSGSDRRWSRPLSDACAIVLWLLPKMTFQEGLRIFWSFFLGAVLLKWWRLAKVL